MVKRQPMSEDDVYCALRLLAPSGTPVTKRELAKKINAATGISVDGAEKALDRDKEKGGKGQTDRFKLYRDGDKFRVPSCYLGAGETMADQIEQARRANEVPTIFQ
jgi:hypothetical protein